ncbi:MAG: hypothetical protein JRF61_25795 [Deltaproteobacteria bacterium]|nr:hypothetical protein [Deltaproteobacteria bacterium]
MLEVAYDLLRHRFLARKIDDESSRSRSRGLLVTRSRIPTPSSTNAPTAEAEGQDDLASTPGTLAIKSSDAGHGTARFELASSFQARDGFLELRVQLAYHELLDSSLGFAKGGQIRVLDTRLRIFPKQERVRFHELVVLDVGTASPWRRPLHPLGWRFGLGLRTRPLDGDDSNIDAEEVFRFQGGMGAGAAPIRRLLVYGFGKLVLEAGAGIEGDVALKPVARSGISWSTAGGRASLQLAGIAGVLTGPETSEWLRAELPQRTSLGEKWAVVLSGRYERAYDADHLEGRVGLTRYF